MISFIKESWKTLNTFGRLINLYLFGLIFLNFYRFFLTSYMKQFDLAFSHLLYIFSLITLILLFCTSVRYFERAKKMYLEIDSIHSNNYEKIRIDMYEKLLSSKEKEIQ